MKSVKEIKWACRRGMLELDLFLVPFSEQKYESLDANLKNHFIELLSIPDPELFDLLMGNKESSNIDEQNIVNLIRDFNRSI